MDWFTHWISLKRFRFSSGKCLQVLHFVWISVDIFIQWLITLEMLICTSAVWKYQLSIKEAGKLEWLGWFKDKHIKSLDFGLIAFCVQSLFCLFTTYRLHRPVLHISQTWFDAWNHCRTGHLTDTKSMCGLFNKYLGSSELHHTNSSHFEMKANPVINFSGKWLDLNMQIRAHFIYWTAPRNAAAVAVNQHPKLIF